MTDLYWLAVSERQLLYIIEGCQIDMPLAEHWGRHFKTNLNILGEGQMARVISSLERKARDALYEGSTCSKYPPGNKKRRKMVVH